MIGQRIEPMPEELAIAHQGRMTYFIGVPNDQAFNRWLKKKVAEKTAESQHMSRLTQLATVSGMGSSEYARLHSMLGILRFTAQPNGLGDHGALEGEAFSKRMGMCLQKKGAYLCPNCVKEDLEHWQFSWFRRTHHLLGVNWCPSHRTPLVKVKSKEPWSMLPQHWVEQGDIEIDGSLVDALDPKSFESRFCEIACSLLSSRGPIDSGRLRQLLVTRAHQMGLRISKLGNRSLVSDHVARVAEKPWLEKHWPEILSKSHGTHLNSLDKIFSSGSWSGTGFAYATALTALWDSPEQVNQLLKELDASSGVFSKPEKKVLNFRGVRYWHGEIWEAYILSQGNVVTMADILGQDRSTLANKMVQIGLPTLRGVNTLPTWKAYLKFEAGMSLFEACNSENAEIGEVEALIRVSCARVASAAKTVIKARNQKQGSDKTISRDQLVKEHQCKSGLSKENREISGATLVAEQAS